MSFLVPVVTVASILKVDAFPITVMFGMCSIFLFVASILQRRLMVIAETQKPSKLKLKQIADNLLVVVVVCSTLLPFPYISDCAQCKITTEPQDWATVKERATEADPLNI